MSIYEPLMGNPFVDAGVSAICAWCNKEAGNITRADLEQMTDVFAPIMCDPGWRGSLQFIFTINSTATNRSIKDNESALRSLWGNYLNAIGELGKAGDCGGCGRRATDVLLTKTGVPLTGSGKLRNFFPLFTEGIGYCAACALAIQFAPLVFIVGGGRFLMVHSNSWLVQKFWARESMKEIREQMLLNNLTGCFNPKRSRLGNSLFYMIQRLMYQYEVRWSAEDVAVTVYYFSNDNRKAELDIYYLPEDVFRFLAYVHEKHFQESWVEIVRSGYRGVKWSENPSEEDYKTNRNLVYERLLNNQSIMRFFLDRREHLKRADWELLTLYLKEVRHMDEARLEALKRVGDSIAETIRQSNSLRRLGQLERASNYRECRNILRFVIRDRISQGQPEPLFSLDDYIQHLFPETEGQFTEWTETRDLLLFRIYETLHDWLRERELPDIVEESEEETEV